MKNYMESKMCGGGKGRKTGKDGWGERMTEREREEERGT